MTLKRTLLIIFSGLIKSQVEYWDCTSSIHWWHWFVSFPWVKSLEMTFATGLISLVVSTCPALLVGALSLPSFVFCCSKLQTNWKATASKISSHYFWQFLQLQTLYSAPQCWLTWTKALGKFLKWLYGYKTHFDSG